MSFRAFFHVSLLLLVVTLVPSSKSWSYTWIYNPTTDHYYSITESQKGWYDAESEAVLQGGHLVTVNDATENTWLVTTFADPISQNLWIGMYQLPGSAEPDGGFVWVSGASVTYTNWYNVDNQEPNDCNTAQGEHEECVELYVSGNYRFMWNDLIHTTNRYGVIERETSPSPVPIPGAVWLLGSGFLGLVAIRKLRR